MAEALDWAGSGQTVEVLCQAAPLSETSEADSAQRSFPAFSGRMPIRITTVLAANLGTACPHLKADMGCAIYASRPLACRIYPAGLDPFAAWNPAGKRCPEEAWRFDRPLLFRGGVCVDAVSQRYREDYHAAALADAERHACLCAALGIRRAALNGEGCVIHRPSPQEMSAALQEARSCRPASTEGRGDWTIVSAYPAMVDALRRLRAVTHSASETGTGERDEWQYLGFDQA